MSASRRHDQGCAICTALSCRCLLGGISSLAVLQSAGQVIIYSNIEHTSRCPFGCMVKALCCLHRLVLAVFALQSSRDTSRCLHRGDMIKAVPSTLPCLVGALLAAPPLVGASPTEQPGHSQVFAPRRPDQGCATCTALFCHCRCLLGGASFWWRQLLVGARPTQQTGHLPVSGRDDMITCRLAALSLSVQLVAD